MNAATLDIISVLAYELGAVSPDDCCPLEALARIAPTTYELVEQDHDDDLRIRNLTAHGPACHFCE